MCESAARDGRAQLTNPRQLEAVTELRTLDEHAVQDPAPAMPERR
ncbi:hypothetical protein [Streptomyces sp. NPDC051310]